MASETQGRAPSPLAQIWAARWLLLQWVKRDYTVQYRQSALGLLWAVVQPLLLLAFYGVVFKTVLKVEAPRGSYLVFALCGLVPWTFVASAASRSVLSLSNASHIVKQVYFPRSIVALAGAGVTVIDLLLSTVVLLVAQVATARELHLATLALVPIYASLLLVVAGLSVFGSLIGGLVRDVRFVVPLLIQVGFIATPVMYPRSLVPGRYAWVYNLNPIGAVIEAVRDAVIDGRWPSIGLLAVLFGAGLAVLGLSISYSAAVESRLPDIL
jgi:lipopolysaccharide transport system permease protein